VAQQARNLAARLDDEGRVLKLLIRDRDSKFVGPFDEVMRAIDARVIKTPVRAPRANVTLSISSPSSSSTATRRGRTVGPISRSPIPFLSGKHFDGPARVRRVDQLGGLLHEYRTAA